MDGPFLLVVGVVLMGVGVAGLRLWPEPPRPPGIAQVHWGLVTAGLGIWLFMLGLVLVIVEAL